MAKWTNKINIPFAENGDKLAVPDTSEDGLVNNTAGFTSRYSQDPLIGGEYIRRETMNAIINDTQKAVKEIQEKTITKINNETPDTEGNIIVSYEGLRDKPTLGSLASLDQVPYQSIGATELQANAVDTRSLKDSSVTRQKIAPAAIDASKIETHSVTAQQLSTTAVIDNMKEQFTESPITGLYDIEIPYINNGQGYRASGASLSAQILADSKHPEIFNFYKPQCMYKNHGTAGLTDASFYDIRRVVPSWTQDASDVVAVAFDAIVIGIHERYTEITGALLETSTGPYDAYVAPVDDDSITTTLNTQIFRTQRYSEVPTRVGLLSFTLNMSPTFRTRVPMKPYGSLYYVHTSLHMPFSKTTPLYKAAFGVADTPVLLSKGLSTSWEDGQIIASAEDIYIPFTRNLSGGLVSAGANTTDLGNLVTYGMPVNIQRYTTAATFVVDNTWTANIFSGAVLTKNNTIQAPNNNGNVVVSPSTFNVTIGVSFCANTLPLWLHLGPQANNTIHFLVDHDKFMRNYEEALHENS